MVGFLNFKSQERCKCTHGLPFAFQGIKQKHNGIVSVMRTNYSSICHIPSLCIQGPCSLHYNLATCSCIMHVQHSLASPRWATTTMIILVQVGILTLDALLYCFSDISSEHYFNCNQLRTDKTYPLEDMNKNLWN